MGEQSRSRFVDRPPEFRARNNPNYDAVCFHAQQGTEKYLKAVLQENKHPIPYVHSLADLLALIGKSDPGFLSIQSHLLVMEGYAVQFRYPGLSADRAEAKEALQASDQVKTFVRAKLGL